MIRTSSRTEFVTNTCTSSGSKKQKKNKKKQEEEGQGKEMEALNSCSYQIRYNIHAEVMKNYLNF